jgi:hypothetical protein
MGLRNHTTVPKDNPTEEELAEADRILDELHKKHGTVYDD